jgi:hypothetical protein
MWNDQSLLSSAPNYRGEGPKLEKCPRSEGPRREGEGESLRITRLGRGIRMYGVAEKCVDLNNKIYNFGSPWLRLLLSTYCLSLPLSLLLLKQVILPLSFEALISFNNVRR